MCTYLLSLVKANSESITSRHLYLGVFNLRARRFDRASALCDGMGTLLHHSAASFIISMLVAGVVPPLRPVLNPCIILVMQVSMICFWLHFIEKLSCIKLSHGLIHLNFQHWVALLKYVSLPAYASIVLVLEYYFEWTVLCKQDVVVCLLYW